MHSLRSKIGVLFRLAAHQTLLPEIACRFVVFLKYQSVARRRPARRAEIPFKRQNFKRFDRLARFKIYNIETSEMNAVLVRRYAGEQFLRLDVEIIFFTFDDKFSPFLLLIRAENKPDGFENLFAARAPPR